MSPFEKAQVILSIITIGISCVALCKSDKALKKGEKTELHAQRYDVYMKLKNILKQIVFKGKENDVGNELGAMRDDVKISI